MRHIPAVLTARDIPAPELDGMRRDGELYALADGWCSIDEFEGPAARAAALRGGRSPRFIAELGSAAWVWGATSHHPSITEFCVDIGARARLHDPLIRVREVVLDREDWIELGAGSVTSPLRTAVDLARFRERLDDDAAAIVALARLGRFGLHECRQLLERRRNLSEKRRALTRLTELLSPR